MHDVDMGDRAFWGEVLLLAVAAPFFYFPERLPAWAPAVGTVLLAAGWLWRRRCLGHWLVRTPADWALLFFLLLLPMAVWVAPPLLRERYAWPRALILLWDLALFAWVVTHASRGWGFWRLLATLFMLALGAIAAVAPLGIDWLYKLPALTPLLERIPRPLAGLFRGAESGFSPNQVAGTLLFGLPLLILLAAASWRRGWAGWLRGLLTLGALGMTAVLAATQSRGGMLGLGGGLLFVLLLRKRWGRRLLAVGTPLAVAGVLFWFAPLVELVGDTPPVEAMGGASTFGFRQDVWTQALHTLQDFPFTGVGLGAFREMVRLLYPLRISPTYDIAHAHNFFLQTALDFGVGGLVALLALYLLAGVQLVRWWRVTAPGMAQAGERIWCLGLAGSLVAQSLYSQLDAVAMGSKPNFLFWFLLALILAAGSRSEMPSTCERP